MAEAKKATAKAAKETTVEAVKDAEAKKVETKETEPKKKVVKPAAETKIQETVHFQFSGKSYTTENLLNSCKDVWKYDLNGKEEDLKTIELYVKPEENTAYYVINGDVTGNFFI